GRGLRRENIVLRRDRHERRNQPIGERLGFILRAIQGQASVPALKGALRDVGKALGLPEDLIKMLSSQVWGWSEAGVRAQCGLPRPSLDAGDDALDATRGAVEKLRETADFAVLGRRLEARLRLGFEVHY